MGSDHMVHVEPQSSMDVSVPTWTQNTGGSRILSSELVNKVYSLIRQHMKCVFTLFKQRDNSQTSGIELRKVSHTTLRNQIPLARKLRAIEQGVSRKNISKMCYFLQVASSHFSVNRDAVILPGRRQKNHVVVQ